MKHQPMSKKTALALFTLFDLMAIVGMWMGYDSMKAYFYGIDNQIEIIKFSNRTGFLLLGIAIIIIHISGFVSFFFPDLIKRNMKIFETIAIALLIVFMSAGFYISSWMQSNLKSEGYTYCRKASGNSALARTLVYTKDMDICENID